MTEKTWDFQTWLMHIQASFQTRDSQGNLSHLLALTKKDSGQGKEDVFHMQKIGDIGFYSKRFGLTRIY